MGILTNLTAAKVSQLSLTRILALTASDIAEMTPEQASGLTASQLIFFNAAQIGALSKAQISAITVPALAGLMPAQIALLKPAQVSGFTAAQIASLNTIQVAALSPAGLAAFSTAQIAALTVSQIGALKANQISALTPAQIAGLGLNQFGALSASQLGALSVTQIKALTAQQLGAMTPAQLAGLGGAQISALSPDQIASLNVKDIAALSGTQLKALSASQVGALTPAQIKALSAAQIGALTPAAQGGFTASQLAGLTPAQKSGLIPGLAPPAPTVQPTVTPAVQPVTPTVTPAPAPTPAPTPKPVAPPAPEVQTPTAQQLAAMTPTQLAALSASQINALNASQLASIKINYNSMLGILQADAADGISDAEFSSLKALVGKFNTSGGISVSDYLEQISDNVVLGDSANATWTGGAAYTMPLGNMMAGSSQAQANQLIGKWFLGTDTPGSRVNMNGAPNFTVTHSAVNQPLYGASGPRIEDVNQGYLGDCFMLAPLAAMALKDPSSIRSMITDNGNNTWGIRFIIDGKTEYVTVNNELANGGGKFASGTNKWVGLVEKGYAQLQAGGNTTGTSASYGNSYSSIANGGSPAVALAELTGAGTISQYVASGAGWSSYEFDGSSLTQRGNQGKGTVLSSKSNLSSAAVQAKLVADLAEGDEVILSSYANDVDASGKTTLVANHAMTVTGFDAATNMFEVYNPWGTSTNGAQNWDTVFQVSLADLLADGDVISVANSTAAAKPIASGPAPLLPTTSQPFGGSNLGLTAVFG